MELLSKAIALPTRCLGRENGNSSKESVQNRTGEVDENSPLPACRDHRTSSCKHTRTHTHMRTHAHMRTHMRARARAHINIHTHMCTHTHTLTYIHSHTYTHTCAHTCAHTRGETIKGYSLTVNPKLIDYLSITYRLSTTDEKTHHFASTTINFRTSKRTKIMETSTVAQAQTDSEGYLSRTVSSVKQPERKFAGTNQCTVQRKEPRVIQ